MGGLVIYGRNLIAICIWESENKDFPCLPINNFVKNNVLPNIEEEVCYNNIMKFDYFSV